MKTRYVDFKKEVDGINYEVCHRYNRSMSLTGYDVYVDGGWLYLFDFGSGWIGDENKAVDDLVKKIELKTIQILRQQAEAIAEGRTHE